MKKTLGIALSVFVIIIINANTINKEDIIEGIKKEYAQKIDEFIIKRDYNYLKLHKQQLLLERKIELKRKDAKKNLEKHLVKMGEYLKKEDNPMVKHLYDEKKQKLAYINEHGNLDGFKLKPRKLTVKEQKRSNEIEQKIVLLQKELNTIDKEMIKQFVKFEKENIDFVQFAQKVYAKEYELENYRNILVVKKYSETVDDCKRFKEIKKEINSMPKISGTFITVTSKRNELFALKEERFQLNKKFNNYKIDYDEKYKLLKNNYLKMEKECLDRGNKIAQTSFGIKRKTKGLELHKKYKEIQKQIGDLKHKKKIELLGVPHQHSANCTHNH